MNFDEFKMDVHVDSDFMGLHGKEKRNDPDNVKCRMGYVIFLNGCPIVWKSSLLQSTCASTMMAEYYSLSTAMREVIPLRRLIETVAKGLYMNHLCKKFRISIYIYFSPLQISIEEAGKIENFKFLTQPKNIHNSNILFGF